ncbi:circadian clock protein KaiC [Methylobacterium sp. Leaf104]|uniref:ATPase domain-containing protein n=1 Tax=Methylobacterium TaxID=407 RepID=UPI0006F9CA5D|nr:MULTISPECIES: ATPase domain-containing protein [Methylobacterium]KQP31254.1 circadian clock protein KaiC [Methylobacterium sp. Leaf104]MCI9881357.1 circadian clock protein KaiC [Methylobacterium goesingense]
MSELGPGTAPAIGTRVSTGIAGLDDILGGGLTSSRLYLLEGTPGTGKTTLALHFLREGHDRGERTLYVTLSETADELTAAAATHGWSLDGIEVYELVNDLGLDPDSEQSILHPSEIELGETVTEVIARVEAVKPARVVFDSLSELRLLAQSPLRYRRQILALKQFFAKRACTVLMLDDRTSETGDVQLHSIAHGVISLDQAPREFGAERRRLRIVKMRGIKFRGGFHDLSIETGGIQVFPRLIAAEHRADFDSRGKSTGSPELDLLLGGGLVPGTNTLLIGPSGVGKTTTGIACMLAALERGETATYYLFDEGLATLLARAVMLGMDLAPHMEAGRLTITQIDPAELSPGEFAAMVRSAVEERGSTFVGVDSLNAYLHAMPGEEFLVLQMHELLSYLNQKGVTTLLVLGQHGILGEVRSDVDLSYLSDCIVLFRFFEAKGEVRTALSVVKSRVNAHERTIRELRLGAGGLRVGEALSDFEGVLTGLPAYHGRVAMLSGASALKVE